MTIWLDKPLTSCFSFQASDGEFADNATVSISIKDVNNNAPQFSQKLYVTSINEDAVPGTQLTQLVAHDGDTNENAEIHFQIQSGSFDEFHVDNLTGIVTVERRLDFDRRSRYSIVVLAVDGGNKQMVVEIFCFFIICFKRCSTTNRDQYDFSICHEHQR